MALKPIGELIAALKGMSLPSVTAARIGDSVPKVPGDLPSIRVAAAELAFSPIGIGGSRNAYLDGSDVPVEDRTRRIKGALNLEFWGADEDVLNAIALAAVEGLSRAETELSGKGFLRLRQSKWRGAEEVPLRGTASDKALRQVLAYEIVFEDVETAPSGGGLIKEIDVRIQPPVGESLDIQ